MTTKLFPFQLEGIDKIEEFGGRALLADEQGMGKTVQSLWWLKENKTSLPAIVVCPAYLRWQWRREASTHIGMPADVLEGMKPPTVTRLGNVAPLTIINYEILGPWIPYLKAMQPQTVIGDEAHYLQSRKAKRTKNFYKLSAGVPHMLLLTGTPIMNRPAELFPLLNLLRPNIWPSFLPYAHLHCGPRRTFWGWEYRGAENLGLLNRKLKRHVLIRRRKVDVLKDLPEKQRNVVVLPLPPKAKREYDAADGDFLAWLKAQGDAGFSQAMRANALTKITTLLGLVGRLKIPVVLEWIKGHFESGGGKLVLFGWHVNVVEAYWKAYKGKSVLVNGTVSTKKRDQAKEQFNNNPDTILFSGNLQAAGTGVSLKAGDLAFAELYWVPGVHSQAESRIHGIGRGVEGKRSQISYLVAEGTLEEDLAEILQRKQAIADKAIDGKRTEDGLDVFDLLLEKLKEKRR